MARKQRHVEEVIDGDTAKLTNGQYVRLEGYDAPEKGQLGAGIFRKKLARLVEDKDVGIEQVARDRYGRPIVRMYRGRESVNKKMQRTRMRRRK